ncbi:MAG: hypothetical protein A2Z38_10825 [Planctomycetes bacterium RBG_19FT_COMBO_48_8]|nr:MAG: hypothetical protein A2Z38_10825 [Planctomycetes bacterium RBG_19FT_COMBO_48_8]
MFKMFCFCIAVVLAGSVYTTAGAGLSGGNRAEASNVPEGIWDPAKYISLDEIKPGMEAYCLTEYGVAGIEKFGMEVVDVVRNINPSSSPGSRDAILVKGTDERFIHTGPVAGCSGSPVYIDGRLAGALAFTWSYAKDPLYGATPIAEMLAVGRGGRTDISEQRAGQMDLGIDFTAPIDFAEIDRRLMSGLTRASHGFRGANYLPCPLITSGLPAEVREQLGAIVEPFGLMVVAGGGSGAVNNVAGDEKVRLAPGASLAIPMVSGDISMSTSGTVTEVIGDKVYAFGHFLLGYGQIDMPMATAKVHTVISNMASSFKLTSVLETVGAVTDDEATGIVGKIGAEAKMIPLTIRIDRYNDTEKRLYNCRLVNNRLLTPFYLRTAVAGAAFQFGDLPPEHMIEYKVNIGIKDAESVTFENVSSGMGLNDVVMECYSCIGLLMNNPYGQVDIESIDCDIRMAPRSIVSHIWSVDLSDSKVKAGRSIEINAVLESVLAGKKQYQWSLEIPEDLAPGKYELTVGGYRDYEQFLVKAVPHRFIAQNLPGLIEALNNSLRIGRDKLYCLLALPPGGVIIEKAELPDLPATKALLLQDTKRVLRVRPYSHWLERRLETGTVLIDKRVLQITVEK